MISQKVLITFSRHLSIFGIKQLFFQAVFLSENNKRSLEQTKYFDDKCIYPRLISIKKFVLVQSVTLDDKKNINF